MSDQAIRDLVLTPKTKMHPHQRPERISLFDEAGNPVVVPTQAELNSQYAPLVVAGVAKAIDGTRLIGLPDTPTGLIQSRTQTVNQSRYYRFIVYNAVLLDQMTFEVSTAPSSAANVRVGVVAADMDWQPSGTAIADAEVAVASGFTGVKTTAVTPVILQPGRYLARSNVDVTMSLRSFTCLLPGNIVPTFGANAQAEFVYASETYGAMADPPAAWTNYGASSSGAACVVALRWSDPLA